MTKITYGELTVTFGNRETETWDSVNLDSVRVEDSILSFEDLVHETGNHYLEWTTVSIPMKNVLYFESVKDKE